MWNSTSIIFSFFERCIWSDQYHEEIQKYACTGPTYIPTFVFIILIFLRCTLYLFLNFRFHSNVKGSVKRCLIMLTDVLVTLNEIPPHSLSKLESPCRRGQPIRDLSPSFLTWQRVSGPYRNLLAPLRDSEGKVSVFRHTDRRTNHLNSLATWSKLCPEAAEKVWQSSISTFARNR